MIEKRNHIQQEDIKILPALLQIIKPQLTTDYDYYNIIKSLWPELRKELKEVQLSQNWIQLRLVRERLRRFFELCGFYEDGIEFAESCLKAVKNEPSISVEQGWILIKDLGWLLILAHKYDESIPKIEEGLELFNALVKEGNSSGNIGIFYALRYLGVAHQHLARINRQRDFSKAKNLYLKAEETIHVCPKFEQDGLKARIYNNFGNIAILEGELDDADNYYRDSEKLFLNLNDNEHLAIVRINLGRLYLTRLETRQKPISYNSHLQTTQLSSKAEHYLRDAMNISIEVGWFEGQARSREHLARLSKFLGRVNNALDLAREALALYRQLGQIESVEKLDEYLVTLKIENDDQFKESNAFIIMPMDSDDDALKFYYNQVKSTCLKYNLVPMRIDEDFSNMEISYRIHELIQHSSVVIADITYERPNVYYEIGIAHQAGKPTILTARHGTKAHFDIRNFPILYYRNADQLAIELEKQIQKMLFLLKS